MRIKIRSYPHLRSHWQYCAGRDHAASGAGWLIMAVWQSSIWLGQGRATVISLAAGRGPADASQQVRVITSGVHHRTPRVAARCWNLFLNRTAWFRLSSERLPQSHSEEDVSCYQASSVCQPCQHTSQQRFKCLAKQRHRDQSLLCNDMQGYLCVVCWSLLKSF